MPRIKRVEFNPELIRFDDPATVQVLFNAIYAISQTLCRDCAPPFEGDWTYSIDMENLRLTEIQYIVENVRKFYSIMEANESRPDHLIQ